MRFKYLALIIIIINMFYVNTYAESVGQDEIIKVGVYEYKPYSYIGKNGEVKGYYSDLLNLLQKEGNFKYEYVVCDFSDGIKHLEDGDIDIMFGLTIDYLDELIEENSKDDDNAIVELWNKYFNQVDKLNYIQHVSMAIMLIIILGIAFIFIIIPKMRLRSIKSKIRRRMNNNSYFLHYQPIYNPKTNEVVAFEALIRLKDKNENIIQPYRFISEIEDNNMLAELSIWILNKITSDYYMISSYENINNIYISMNVSLNEIENEEFVDNAIEILLKSNIESKRICLEITERVKMENLDNLKKSIKRLKDAGFKIAIDDFGVEYSNLDVLKKLDFDVIKLDKYFIDDVCDCNIKEEIIMFMSKIAKRNGKALIIEGVEDKSQNELIKSIYNERLYVQGYLYNKPMPIEQIKLI